MLLLVDLSWDLSLVCVFADLLAGLFPWGWEWIGQDTRLQGERIYRRVVDEEEILRGLSVPWAIGMRMEEYQLSVAGNNSMVRSEIGCIAPGYQHLHPFSSSLIIIALFLKQKESHMYTVHNVTIVKIPGHLAVDGTICAHLVNLCA